MVNVYTDGTVMVSHGGLELGQGINTKLLQVASRALNIPLEKIAILENASDKVPNATVTGGSQGSDIHGLAVKVRELLYSTLDALLGESTLGRTKPP